MIWFIVFLHVSESMFAALGNHKKFGEKKTLIFRAVLT